MEQQKEWVFFREIDFNCPNSNAFSIDTRDFHCVDSFKENPHEDFETLKKYPHFFHTHDELVNLIERYYIDSGGEQDWRFFNLKGIDNWNMKYIRIERTELGFIVCDSWWKALNKGFLSAEVEDKEW